jgi:hypothetical protein
MEAVADGDVDEAILAAYGYGWLGPILGQWKQPTSLPASEYYTDYVVHAIEFRQRLYRRPGGRTDCAVNGRSGLLANRVSYCPRPSAPFQKNTDSENVPDHRAA